MKQKILNNTIMKLMENKQTALQWLESQEEIQNMINLYSPDAQLFLRMVFNKAKAMEKEQIKEAQMEGNETFIFNGTAIDYYKKTYGKANI